MAGLVTLDFSSGGCFSRNSGTGTGTGTGVSVTAAPRRILTCVPVWAGVVALLEEINGAGSWLLEQ
jgi:hypothetical protein